MFATICDDDQTRGTYRAFLNVDQNHNLTESDTLIELKGRYEDVIHNSINHLKTLALLEEIIIQIRCKEVIDKEIRLSLSRNYIYARSLFYRKDNLINDIRVMVGKIEDWNQKWDTLLTNRHFNIIAKTMLIEAMDREINANINQLNKILQCQES